MTQKSNNRVAGILAGVVVTMVALSFAAVPFYSWFCRTTGYNGTPSVAQAAPDKILDRYVIVRFDSNTGPRMPWEFRPKQKEVRLRLGETGLVFFEAYNPTDKTMAGQAAYNVAPDSAGRYFDKIACFCFDLQVLKPGERVEMPVTFFVDPEMLSDDDAKGIKAITLSYTMYETKLPDAKQASATDQIPVTRVAAGSTTRADQTIER